MPWRAISFDRYLDNSDLECQNGHTMLHERTRAYITGLNDADLLAYVLTGERVYEPEAISFAKEEVARRKMPADFKDQVSAQVATALATYDRHAEPNPMKPPMGAPLCVSCGIEAPVAHVEYNWNIGLMIVRFSGGYHGYFCRSCNWRYFWQSMAITFFLGWWGLISFFVTIGFLMANVIACVRSWSLAPAPPSATHPVFDQRIADRLEPYLDAAMSRLKEGAPAVEVAREIAPIAGVTPGEAWVCLQHILAQPNSRIMPIQFASRSVSF